MTSADVLVVGGGPAGSTTALLLARRGWGVVLLDRARFPRAKACGECLNPGAVGLLTRFGLLGRVLALGPATLTGWTLESGGRAATGSFPNAALGLSLPRVRFDAELLHAARDAGVRVEEGARVLGLAGRSADGRAGVIVRRDGGAPHVETARVVVGADGLRSTLARGIAAYRRPPRLRKLSVTMHVEGVDADPTRGQLHLDQRGTVGVAPLDPGGRAWNATVVVDAEAEGRAAAGDPGGFARERFAQVVGRELGPTLDGPWTSGPFDWPNRHAVADGVVLVGDAAGYYDPLTGQGIYRALRSAELAAATIDEALRGGGTAARDLAPYERALRGELRAPLRVQHGVEAVLASRSLRAAALAVLGRRPHATDTIIGVTGDMTPARALLGLRFWTQLMQQTQRAG